jgi:hypothetical protein
MTGATGTREPIEVVIFISGTGSKHLFSTHLKFSLQSTSLWQL